MQFIKSLRSRLATVAVTALVGCFGASVHAQDADVIIMAGQSNMMGHGTAENQLPQYLRSKQNDLYIAGLLLTNGDWRNMDAPNTGKYGNDLEFSGFGPEITFARKVSDTTGRPTYILKWALGGQNLHNDFLGKGGKGSDALYPYLVREKSKIVKSLKDQYGLNAKFKAFIWMQGESDANAELSGKYRNNMDDLASRVRKDFGSNIPMIAGRINRWQNTGDWNRVRDAQVAWANSNGKNHWINTDNFNTYSNDGVHFNAKGLQDLGYAFADKYLQVVGSKPSPNPDKGLAGVKRLKDGWKGFFVSESGENNWSTSTAASNRSDQWSQQWVLERYGNSGNVYRIKNRWTNQYLSAPSQNEWDNLYVANLNKDWSSQRWIFESTDGGRYRIKNQWSKFYIQSPEFKGDAMRQAAKRDSWGSMKFKVE